MTTDEQATSGESTRTITSKELAVFVVDALYQAGIVQKDRIEEAIEIADEEIVVWTEAMKLPASGA
jgi:hypothetical protein